MTCSSGHTARVGSHGSAAGSMPVADCNAVPTSRPGNGNSTLAQTPSPRPEVAPSTFDSRCVSHRSMPRDGTATTSGANGSATGSASTAASASTRRSARSARCTVSIGGRPPAIRRRRTRTPSSPITADSLTGD